MLKWISSRMTPARLALALFVAVISLWALWLLWGVQAVLDRLGGKDAVAPLGQVGDLFGGVNALFAAFAFAGVAVAAYYQHLSWKLLSEQSRREDARHARESFQPLFFHLLSEAPDLPQALARTSGMLTGSLENMGSPGAPAYRTDDLAIALRNQMVTTQAYADARLGNRNGLPSVLAFYDALYAANESALGPFFRAQYHVFSLIDRSGLDPLDKVQYANIARARLNVTAVCFLTMNCCTTRGNRFKPLVENYGLLKHVYRTGNPDLPSVDEEIAAWCYSPTATMDAKQRDKYWKFQKAQTPARGATTG